MIRQRNWRLRARVLNSALLRMSMCVASFILLSTMVSPMLKVCLSLCTLLRSHLRSHLFVNCCIRRYSIYIIYTMDRARDPYSFAEAGLVTEETVMSEENKHFLHIS